MKLHLSPDLALPLDAVTQTFGILAVRGAGKSNTAAAMAEEMFKAGLPFVVVDPVGSWWGLRSSSDGKGAGIPIPIFGGRHGDVPLEKTGGAMLADAIVEQRLSCVLDISELSEGDKTRFLIDFAERLYRKNTEPLHLFLEEADDYAPQRPFREQARLLRAWENLVRRGRSRGLGITMITQRSASINKSVLTQIETLIVLRTTSPQDRKAISAWIEYHGQAKEILDSLPGLAAGEAWVWSPSWLKTMKRVQIRRRGTFDSGATPKDVKGRRPAATLADVDLGKLKTQMAATIEKAKAEDPKELRKALESERAVLAMTVHRLGGKVEGVPTLRINFLQRIDELREIERSKAAPERFEVPAVDPRDIEALDKIADGIREACEPAIALLEGLGKRLAALATIEKQHAVGLARVPGFAGVTRIPKTPASISSGGRHAQALGNGDGRRPASDTRTSGVGAPLPLGERRILTAVAQYEGGVDREKLSVLTGYKRSSRDTYLQRLRERDLISIRGDSILATSDGEAALGADFEPLPTGSLLRAHWLERLPEGERRILEVLVDAYPREIDRAHLDTVTGYKRSSRDTYLQRLSARKLVQAVGRGAVVASRELFS